jgi:hypothetical protein
VGYSLTCGRLSPRGLACEKTAVGLVGESWDRWLSNALRRTAFLRDHLRRTGSVSSTHRAHWRHDLAAITSCCQQRGESALQAWAAARRHVVAKTRKQREPSHIDKRSRHPSPARVGIYTSLITTALTAHCVRSASMPKTFAMDLCAICRIGARFSECVGVCACPVSSVSFSCPLYFVLHLLRPSRGRKINPVCRGNRAPNLCSGLPQQCISRLNDNNTPRPHRPSPRRRPCPRRLRPSRV